MRDIMSEMKVANFVGYVLAGAVALPVLGFVATVVKYLF